MPRHQPGHGLRSLHINGNVRVPECKAMAKILQINEKGEGHH
jgi:hypothetical protein